MTAPATLSDALAAAAKSGPFSVWLRDGSLIRNVTRRRFFLGLLILRKGDQEWFGDGKVLIRDNPVDIVAIATPAELAAIDALRVTP